MTVTIIQIGDSSKTTATNIINAVFNTDGTVSASTIQIVVNGSNAQIPSSFYQDVMGNSPITGNGGKNLQDALNVLTTLSFGVGVKLGSDSFRAATFNKLISLDFSNITDFGSNTFLGDAFPKLTILTFTSNTNFGSNTFRWVSFISLQTLCFPPNTKFGSNTFQNTAFTSLQTLSFGNNNQLGSNTFDGTSTFPALRQLNFGNDNQLGSNTFKDSSAPNLKTLVIGSGLDGKLDNAFSAGPPTLSCLFNCGSKGESDKKSEDDSGSYGTIFGQSSNPGLNGTCSQTLVTYCTNNGTCISSSTCNPACTNGNGCNNGTCQCGSGAACTGNNICQNGTCVDSEGSPCSPDCTNGNTCVNGTCECGSGTACTGNNICVNGTCTANSSCATCVVSSNNQPLFKPGCCVSWNAQLQQNIPVWQANGIGISWNSSCSGQTVVCLNNINDLNTIINNAAYTTFFNLK